MMWKTAFHAEFQKAKRRHELLLCLLVPLVIIVWVGGLQKAGEDELANGYSELFYSIPVINAILLPVMMAVLASRLWDMEVKGSTTKLLYTLQSRKSLFAGKVSFGLLEVLLTTALEMGMIRLLGIIKGYTEKFPVGQFWYLAVCTLVVNVMLFLSEWLLMLLFENPLPAICVGIVGAMIGLFSAFMPEIVSYFVPWGYYVPLGGYEVKVWEQETHTVLYGTRGMNWGLLGFTILLAAVFLAAAWRVMRNKEV